MVVGKTAATERVCVAVGSAVNGMTGGFPPCPPPDGGGLGVFVQTGGTGVSVGIAVSEGVTPGGKVWLGVLVEVGEGVSVGVGVSDGVTPGASVSVAVGVVVSVSVGDGVKVSVGTGVKVFVETGGGGET